MGSTIKKQKNGSYELSVGPFAVVFARDREGDWPYAVMSGAIALRLGIALGETPEEAGESITLAVSDWLISEAKEAQKGLNWGDQLYERTRAHLALLELAPHVRRQAEAFLEHNKDHLEGLEPDETPLLVSDRLYALEMPLIRVARDAPFMEGCNLRVGVAVGPRGLANLLALFAA